jgi:ParB family chromosome partitioning protein
MGDGAMSIRDQLMAATADLPSTAEMKGTEIARPQRDPDRPKTAVGSIAALSAAKLRIQELEQELTTKGAASVLPVDRIVRNPWQPRTRFVQAYLEELAENIREVGLMQPILVRATPGEEGEEAPTYQIIAGERRWRAHKLNDASEIKVLIVEASDADMAVMALTENINRQDLTDYEISRGLVRAEKEFPNRKRMAEGIGITRASLYRYLAFANLPQFMIEDLEVKPELFGGTSAHETLGVLKKYGARAESVAQELWKQMLSGSLEQTKFAAMLEATLARKSTTQPASTQRDIRKVYAGKVQAGSITKDAASFTVKLKSNMLTAAQEERIRALVSELYEENQVAG